MSSMGRIRSEEFMERFDGFLSKYIPPREKWLPPDEALYGVRDLYRVEPEEAGRLRFKAIKYTFKHHYEKNRFFNKLCKEKGVSPDEIKKEEDFLKIPLLPDKFFKDYPEGKGFAIWIANIYTGDLPNIFIRKRNPGIDDIIDAFNEKGLSISYSSGTSGRLTFIPRDKRTLDRAVYCGAKGFACMTYPKWDPDKIYGFLSFYARNTNMFAGVLMGMLSSVLKHLEYGILLDRRVTAGMLQTAMMRKRSIIVRGASLYMDLKARRRFMGWLKERDRRGDDVIIFGAPFFLNHIMDLLDRKGLYFDFGEGSFAVTGGGWKIREDIRITMRRFREKVEKVFGIPQTNCIDVYGMVEGNGFMVHCPEGHYLHIPYSCYYPIVLDKNGEPVSYGEKGRFAFLDPLATSYPGFIISGDEVRLLEHCPVCDRPGPVLEPEIERARGEEVRGCAEEMRRMLGYGD